jgi:PAS domain S-box-containing protein
MDRIPVMITLYDPDTRVLRLNREFERTLGWTTEEAKDIDLMAACYPDAAYREEVRGFMEALAPGWRDVEMTARDGRVIETSWANVRLWNDVRVGIGLDVRERRRAERERDALMGRERAARAEAEASNRAKDEFLAMLGHELRNPLGAIGSAVRVLGLLGADGDAGQRPREVIERQVAHLSRLVDDLLDVARVSSGQVLLAQQACDLGALVRQVVATFRASHRLDGHEVNAETPAAWVEADPVRLEQVIANLLDNALKYTPAGGLIHLAVHGEPDAAVLTVSDTGAGIPAHLLARVFDLFVQGERGTDRGQGGLGIGLTLVRRLVELHQGTVEAASAGAGRGATFTVRLPRALPPAEAAAADPPAAAHRLRILLVEDNADAREMLSAALRLQGHEVHVASDGPEGVSAALALQPDAALVDIGLPGFDGYEVARRIRAGRPTRATRLVALTGYGQPEDRRRTRDAGFDDHLVKPVDPGRVAEVLKP